MAFTVCGHTKSHAALNVATELPSQIAIGKMIRIFQQDGLPFNFQGLNLLVISWSTSKQTNKKNECYYLLNHGQD
jgi:hypothetical protein